MDLYAPLTNNMETERALLDRKSVDFPVEGEEPYLFWGH
jgi:hypothetical protein